MAYLLGLLVAVSSGTWTYNKFLSRTGHNTKSSLIGAAVVGFIAFVITATVYTALDASLSN